MATCLRSPDTSRRRASPRIWPAPSPPTSPTRRPEGARRRLRGRLPRARGRPRRADGRGAHRRHRAHHHGGHLRLGSPLLSRQGAAAAGRSDGTRGDRRDRGGGPGRDAVLARRSGGRGIRHRLRVPVADTNLLRVPDGMEDERALFVGDILTTGVYGAGIADIGARDTVAVVGAGPVGFFAAQSARDEATGGRGADVVIEAVGSEPAWETALHVVRRGGTLVVLGMYVSERVELQLGVAWNRAVRFVFAGVTPIHAWWEEAMAAVADGSIHPLPIISHTLPLEDASTGYELFDRREATKVLLKP